LADKVVLSIYECTREFPKEELLGMTSQMRRAAVSAPCNIVEGCARDSEADYLRFLDIAYASSRELQYQLSLAHRLGYLSDEKHRRVKSESIESSKALNGLIRSLRGGERSR
jgi:four helix bundle protein